MIEVLKQMQKALKEYHYYTIDAGLPNQSMLNKGYAAYQAGKQAIAELESQERNFCPRCGKRLGGEDSIHTCTPPQRTEQDWDALAEKQLASIKRDMKATFEDAVVRATPKVMAEFEAQAEQEPPKYSFKAYWEANGRIGVVACIVRPDGGVHLMSEILDLPPSTEPQYTPEHQARIAAFKDAMHIAKEKNT